MTVLFARAHVVSSIRTTDAPISRFLTRYRVATGNVRHCFSCCSFVAHPVFFIIIAIYYYYIYIYIPKPIYQALMEAVKGVTEADANECVHFFPVLANGLLTIICSVNEAHSMVREMRARRCYGH